MDALDHLELVLQLALSRFPLDGFGHLVPDGTAKIRRGRYSKAQEPSGADSSWVDADDGQIQA